MSICKKHDYVAPECAEELGRNVLRDAAWETADKLVDAACLCRAECIDKHQNAIASAIRAAVEAEREWALGEMQKLWASKPTCQAFRDMRAALRARRTE